MTEAAKLKKTLNKSKLKKSIKSVLCRPDPVFWPTISAEDASKLEVVLNVHKIKLPEYRKPHWNEIKLIQKMNRPKPPTIPKVSGLIFGISESCSAIEKEECSAVIIEALVNPRTIVHPILEKCYSTMIPVVCLDNLRNICANCFGIRTSCLGIRKNSLPDLESEVLSISKGLKHPQLSNRLSNVECKMEIVHDNEIIPDKTCEHENTLIKSNTSDLYLYRTNKRSRVFSPCNDITSGALKKFKGQDLIEFSHKEDNGPEDKLQMKMILKRLSNNPNRKVKRK